MTRLTPLASFRLRQREMQLAASTVTTSVVVLEPAIRGGPVGSLECGFLCQATSGQRFDLRLRERWAPLDDSIDRILYSYSLSLHGGPEVLAYHLHPLDADLPRYHLHLGQGSGMLAPELVKAHLPSGPISVAEFLRFAIRDWKVRALRPDWRSVLERLTTRPR